MVNGVSTLPVPSRLNDAQQPALATAAAPVVAPSGFIAGQENSFLAAVLGTWCDALADGDSKPGDASWERLTSPLVLVGSTGSGKSHLAHGLAELAGDQRAVYTTANDLRREFATAIDEGGPRAWRDRISATAILVIDDLDHLPVRSHFQQELLHLAHEIESRGHKLVATSAQPIAHLPAWLPDLVNWFASGLTLEISPLGADSRYELLTQFAATNQWQLPSDAIELLVEHTPPEPREMFRLAADMLRQFGTGARLETDTLAHFIHQRKAAQAPELRDIVRVVARYYRIPLKSLTSASRQAAVVSARATAIYLARTLTSASYEQIGKHLGGRDHSTIMYSHRQVEKRLTREAALRSAIDDLTRLLRK